MLLVVLLLLPLVLLLVLEAVFVEDAEEPAGCKGGAASPNSPSSPPVEIVGSVDAIPGLWLFLPSSRHSWKKEGGTERVPK
jgi:hypothetical protein